MNLHVSRAVSTVLNRMLLLSLTMSVDQAPLYIPSPFRSQQAILTRSGLCCVLSSFESSTRASTAWGQHPFADQPDAPSRLVVDVGSGSRPGGSWARYQRNLER